jgi:hypothetical protein
MLGPARAGLIYFYCGARSSLSSHPLGTREAVLLARRYRCARIVCPQLTQVFAIEAEERERCYSRMCYRIATGFFPPG